MPETRKSIAQVSRKQSRAQPSLRRDAVESVDNSDADSDVRCRRISKAASVRSASSLPKKTAKLENTYQLGPSEESKFRSSPVKDVALQTLEKFLKGVQYDPIVTPKFARQVADEINDRLKQLCISRHKFVTHVIILESTEGRSPSVKVASRCLWNSETDSFISVTFENESIYSVATVYGLYYE